MRLSIVHDSAGTITGLIAAPPDAPMAHLDTKPGERVAEVDAPEIDAALDAQEILARLANLAENYRVEIKGAATLTPKG